MSKKPNKSFWNWLLGRLRTRFLSGLLVVVPIAATVLILVWVFRTIDDILQPAIKGIIGHTVTGLGFGITIALVFIVGIIAGNYVGGVSSSWEIQYSSACPCSARYIQAPRR